MVYSTAEYLGMALLVVAFLGAGFALLRLDHALNREPESGSEAEFDESAQAEAGSTLPPEIAETGPAVPKMGGKPLSASAPRTGAARRPHRKHGR